MQLTFWTPGSKASLIVAMMATLLLYQTAEPATTTSATVLQQCPSIEEEIVDLEMLSQALRDSTAVGLFEKIKLKGSIDDLVKRLEAYHDGARKFSIEQLEEQYNVLLMRIASHLQNKDQLLHQQLCNAWLTIWLDLEDSGRFREKFST
ncbi:hypothetical protein ACFL1C_00475 [Pseudomonadota bacterium]|jgi:hypothetical protein